MSSLLSAVIVVLAVVCRHCTAPEGGCTPSPPSSLIPGADKTGVIPDIRANARGTVVDCANTIKPILSVVSVLQSQVGGRRISPWTVFSATQIQQHGLWCQVNSASNAGMGNNIGDMFYSTENEPDGFTIVPTNGSSNNVPYQQLKCTNQIGVVVDGNVTSNYEGFVKCNTTLTNLKTNTNYWVVYSDAVFNSYCKLYHNDIDYSLSTCTLCSWSHSGLHHDTLYTLIKRC